MEMMSMKARKTIWRESLADPGPEGGVAETLSESFDVAAEDERRCCGFIEVLPCMVRPSNHSEPFLSTLLVEIELSLEPTAGNGSKSFPHAFSGNPGKTRTRHPIKHSGGG